eukprot:scaffold57988_cov52-Phaeocystis_antarctica.AAC.3
MEPRFEPPAQVSCDDNASDSTTVCRRPATSACLSTTRLYSPLCLLWPWHPPRAVPASLLGWAPASQLSALAPASFYCRTLAGGAQC